MLNARRRIFFLVCFALAVGSAFLCAAFILREPETLNEERLKKLDAQLRADTRDVEFGSEEFFESPAFRQATAGRSHAELLHMARQSDHYFVALAGFQGLKTRFPDSAFDVAVEIVAKSERPASLMHAHLYLYLGEIPNSAESRKRLDTIEKVMPFHFVNLDILARALNKDLLHDWFHERQGRIEQPWMATVLAELYAQNPKAPTKKMKIALEECGQERGLPRLTYLYLQTDADEKYVERLRSCLEDATLDDMDVRFLARHRRELIAESIVVEKLELSEDRRRLIEQAIEDRDE